jgi:DNA phosphorothioation system restriction enzyme
MLSTLPIRISYRSGQDDVLEDFYRPCLEQAVLYRRAVGYFTSAGLTHAAKGLASLVVRGGKMRLVASPQLSDDDIEALSRAAKDPEQVLGEIVARSLQDVSDLLVRERLNALAWLAARGALEVKLAIRLNAQGQLARGIYHEKIGVFSDAAGNHVAFAGSSNETQGGLVDNFESIKVFWSWDDSQRRVKEEIENFDALWENKTRGLRVLDFSKTARELLKRYQQASPPGTDAPCAEDTIPYGLPTTPKIPDWVQLRDYQEGAIKAWGGANGQGILSMATGTGKTLIALVLAMRVYGKNQPLLLVVVCPFINLAEQWVRELAQFGVPSTRCYHSSERWRNEAQEAVQRLQSGLDTIRALVVTNRTFSMPVFQSTLRPEAFHHLLIADEVHNLGAEHAANALPQGIKLRLGLSATPKRHMDDAGTKRIMDFFGGVVFEFGIKEALNTPAGPGSEKTVLCPYEYHPIVVTLDDDEADTYADLTARLVRCLNPDADGEPSDSAKRLLIARARLLAGARQKLPALDNLLRQLPTKPKKALFYCGDGTTEDLVSEEDARQIDAVTRLIGERHDLKVRTFTCREKSSEREDILTALRDGKLDGVVAIRCLDEGIDVPDLRMGFLLASSTNPRQFVQRRGRLLRNAPGKDRAIIYDFIVRPPDFGGSSETASYNMERSMFKRELVRIVEFCDTAVNGAQALNSLMQLRIDYGLLGQ